MKICTMQCLQDWLTEEISATRSFFTWLYTCPTLRKELKIKVCCVPLQSSAVKPGIHHIKSNKSAVVTYFTNK